jgi:hypothetical protein
MHMPGPSDIPGRVQGRGMYIRMEFCMSRTWDNPTLDDDRDLKLTSVTRLHMFCKTADYAAIPDALHM